MSGSCVTSLLIGLLLTAAFATGPAVAKVDLVAVESPQDETWVGEMTPFYVKLRAKGPFVGAASFTLPQLPDAVIVKIGAPVVSSEEIEDDTWLVQTHEFALFSQTEGDVELPSFEVRFGNKESYTGPEVDHTEQVPALVFHVKRPTDSADVGFLVTTEELQVEQSWAPQPADAKQGDVFRRTITQSADNVAGMALAPPSTNAPEGIRVYVEKPVITDQTERGDVTGSRSDTLTYLMEQPGTFSIPAVKYVWWNPEAEKYGSTTLPAVTVTVAALPAPKSPTQAAETELVPWVVLAVATLLCIVAIWQRERLVACWSHFRRWLNPPERVAARTLLQACRRDEPAAAEAAWLAWQNLQPAAYRPSAKLRTECTRLARHLYGPSTDTAWRGAGLAKAFRAQTAERSASTMRRPDALAPLNPY